MDYRDIAIKAVAFGVTYNRAMTEALMSGDTAGAWLACGLMGEKMRAVLWDLNEAEAREAIDALADELGVAVDGL